MTRITARTKATAVFSKEKSMALQSSIKGFTYRKSFILPIMDPKLNPMFKELIAFRWRLKLQKVLVDHHIS